jgi:iron complex outermembrane recepter protein
VLTVPDALRLVPGVHVAQINSNEWSVSIRGFSSRFVDTLLVMVDGQSVYSLLYSGVFWNALNLSVAEIDRIEVIRGPGGTMWGANAVNGVINIITQTAAASRGTSVTVSTGNAGYGRASFHTAASVNQSTSYRLDVTAGDDQSVSTVGVEGDAPRWRVGRVSGRFDAAVGGDEVSLIGSATRSRGDVTLVTPSLLAPYSDSRPQVFGRDVFSAIGRWTRHRERTETAVQASAEYTDTALTVLSEQRMSLAMELQQAWAPSKHRHVVWGVSYSRSTDDTAGTSVITFNPASRTLSFASVFAQGEVGWFDGRLRLTAGTKFERNDFSGWELQPNVRAFFQLSKHQSVWAAVSRAVGLPSRGQSDGVLEPIVAPPTAQVPLPQVVQFVGNGGREPALSLTAFELGYRMQPHPSVSLDISSYFNDYRHLLGSVPGVPRVEMLPVPHVVQPMAFVNGVNRRYKGGELSVEWRPSPRLRVTGGYSAHVLDRQVSTIANGVGSFPPQQALFRVSTTLPANIEADVFARRVGALPDTIIEAYSAVDARIGRRWGRFEVSLVGRNLVGANHLEFIPDPVNSVPTTVRRSFWIQLTGRF